ncbi:glycoside hydrolase family 97 protein [Gallaecimonas pentaromativorans]|uniref:Alpha-glucosidase n=1 Tax=Gallaecimonas pentaromativorans TaxID=584787 RepID=A0A3N1PF49_9GAMM|nr:glycoside hydrolase family 97 protein [Gallaecimonas pentaromativorans]ROQ25921.1 alpha-glucosidase [Gallaecimonas pentaromativorans]
MRAMLPLLLMLGPASVLAQSLAVSSPDGKLTFTLSDDDTPHYQVSREGRALLGDSALGLSMLEIGDMGPGYRIVKVARHHSDSQWEQPWGERHYVQDNHNELAATFANDAGQRFVLRVRVFDDGLGFRYEVPAQPHLSTVNITDERTEFRIAGSDKVTAWSIPARQWDRYEYPYRTSALEAVQSAQTPLTMKLPGGVHLSIHEAALVNYAAMTLNQRRPGVLKADLTPWGDGIKVKTAAPFMSPWRTIEVGSATDLVNSSLILNLNEPNKLGDVSWVKPGKYIGIWWAMHLGRMTWGSGPHHGATTVNAERYMDFAARYGFDGVLVEGWNQGWDGDWVKNGDKFSFTQPYPDFDIKAITAYGAGKGVKLIGHHETGGHVSNYEAQLDDAMALYQRLGVSQVKTGYVADGGEIDRRDAKGIRRHEWHDGQFMVNHYQKVVTEAAKYHIAINSHEPIKDTGLRRTYPNWISREGARGQEYNAWGTPPNSPEHTVMLPFTRLLAGPMDFTPGIFDLAPTDLKDGNRVQTTLAKQLALYVTIYSPIQMAADLPENYQKHLDAFQFIRDVPTDWEESKALAGAVGDYLVMARKARGGKDWYLGAITDEQARVLPVKLDFLDSGTRYEAQIYRDGAKADWQSNPYDYVIEKKTVSRSDTLALKLATSGGAAIRFKALEQ